MSESILIDIISSLGEDIRAMRKDIARLARQSYLCDLELVANTSARQEMWRLCDGTLSSEAIAKKIGVTTRSVQYFVQDAEKKGLIVPLKRGYPRRTDSYDDIPSDWKPYKKSDNQISSDVTTDDVQNG